MDIEYTDDVRVCCDGGAQGHPKIYLCIDESGKVACPYCNRQFVLKKRS